MVSKLLKIVMVAYFLIAAPLSHSQDGDYLQGIPASDGPLEVRFGFNLVNITDVNEREETIDFDGQLILSWIDSRLAYNSKDYGVDGWTRGDYSKAPRRVYLNNSPGKMSKISDCAGLCLRSRT